MLLLIALVACERADRTRPTPAPPTPAPPTPDPIRQAHDEFELVSLDQARGAKQLYTRGDLVPNAAVAQPLDEGGFVGRMITLFGEGESHTWNLRDKQTGLIVTAAFGDKGPSYGGIPREAGPELAAIARRLDALVSQVAPADWDTTRYYAEPPRVVYVGEKGGVAFADEMAPHDALAFLLDMAGRTDGYELDLAALIYYGAHKAELRDQRSRMQQAYRTFVALARKADANERKDLLEQAAQLRP